MSGEKEMMITDALKAGKIDRIISGDSWLTWDTDEFVVRTQGRYKKMSKILCETKDEEEAVARLIRS